MRDVRKHGKALKPLDFRREAMGVPHSPAILSGVPEPLPYPSVQFADSAANVRWKNSCPAIA
jgi:hypothetical protein